MSEVDAAVEEYEDWYNELQNNFNLTYFLENSLVTPVENNSKPIHRWYSLKEGFSSELPTWVVDYLNKKYSAEISRVLDPFIGGGTTGVSLALHGISVDGVEYNPFVHLVASVKSSYCQLDKAELTDTMQCIDLHIPNNSIVLPVLSTLKNKKYFHHDDVQIMLNAVRQINELDVSELTRDALLLGVASSAEQVAHLRKDGRALRYKLKTNKPTAAAAIQSNWWKFLEDIGKERYVGRFTVHRGTAIDLQGIADERFDLALYSPPYANNFDYSEIYKLELWLLGFVKSVEDWRDLRRSTIRSHPSVIFKKDSVFASIPRLTEVYEMLKSMRDAESLVGSRSEVSKFIVGYFEDMYLALKEQERVLKPGGFLVYVVANSRHKYLPVATDVIIGEIARMVGFQPLDLIVLKQRNGRTRQKTYLRESAVVMRKPLR